MLRAATAPPRLPTLMLLCGLSVMSLNMFLPSLAHIADTFQVDYALANLAIAGYAGVTAALQLVMGPLSDRFGRRPVILTGLAIFTAASVGCALASDIWTFLACRVMQGAVFSGFAVSQAVVRDSHPPQKAASLLGAMATVWAVAPMLGPTLGGTLDQLFGWRASLWTLAGLGLVMLVVCWLDLGETNRTRSQTFAQQFRAYPALLRAPRFWGYASCTAFSVGAFYAFLGGAPLVARGLFAMPPAVLGLCIGSITAGFLCGSFLTSRFATRFPLSTLMLTGRIVACFGLLLGLVLLACGIVHPVAFFGSCAFVGIGNGLTTPSANAGTMSVRPELAGSAAGLSAALTIAGGAVLSSITGTVLTEANAGYGMLAIMLASSLCALVAALAVRHLDRREAP